MSRKGQQQKKNSISNIKMSVENSKYNDVHGKYWEDIDPLYVQMLFVM